MRMMRLAVTVGCLAVLFVPFAFAKGYAQGIEQGKPSEQELQRIEDAKKLFKRAGIDSLRNSAGIYVMVSPIPVEFEAVNSKTQIKQYVELRLREAGIKVLDEPSDVGIHLWIVVDRVPTPEKLPSKVGTIDIGAWNTCFLKRNRRQEIIAQTWSTRDSFINPVRGEIRERCKSILDAFLNHYLEANPKK